MGVQQVFFQGRNAMPFNFPAERMKPMANIEKEVEEFISRIEEEPDELAETFQIRVELDEKLFHRAVALGMTCMSVWPEEVTNVASSYSGTYKIECICRFDQIILSNIDTKVDFEVPEKAFNHIVLNGLQCVMGNHLVAVEIKNVFSHIHRMECILTFREDEQ